MRLLRLAGIALALLLPAAGHHVALADAPAPVGTPQAGLREAVLQIHTSDGVAHGYVVELAETPRQQAIGMMFRTSMPRDRGMLFPFPEPRWASFYMRNTLVPLDIIFIGPERQVLNIGQGRPLDETSISATGPASAVLELNAGEAARIGLKPGDRIDW